MNDPDFNTRLVELRADYERIQRTREPIETFVKRVCLLVGETEDLEAAWNKIEALVKCANTIIDGRSEVLDKVTELYREHMDTMRPPPFTGPAPKPETN